MAKVCVLGAGVAGHTAALVLRRKLGKNHEVIVVSPASNYQWIPSNIWVGVGYMKPSQVVFELAPVYKRQGIRFEQAKAMSIFPEGEGNQGRPFVRVRYTAGPMKDTEADVEFDYLINATGPGLNFAATPGLGPHAGNTTSVCTYQHAADAFQKLEEAFARMEQGQKQRFVIGTGHPMATCQGAAFEYILNVAFEVKKRKLQHLAELIWLTNEYELGDFGMGGAFIKRGGYITSTKVLAESILIENGIRWVKRAGVKKVEGGTIHFETLAGEEESLDFDFAMLIPSFSGVGIQAFDRQGKEITSTLFAPSGFMYVDANYGPTPFEQWHVSDWPSLYQSPRYDFLYAAGIAFAPPHPISKPMENSRGTKIFPTPPRTGMPSGVMGKIVALNVADRIMGKAGTSHKASMGKMGAACIVSAGAGVFSGQAASLTVFPIVPDYEKYPEWGRDLSYTVGEVGTAGHWIKVLLHYLFMYKAKARPFWWMIPE